MILLLIRFYASIMQLLDAYMDIITFVAVFCNQNKRQFFSFESEH